MNSQQSLASLSPRQIQPEVVIVGASCEKPKMECDPCKKQETESGWGWLGALILWFIVFTVLFWLIFYSLKPSFVMNTSTNTVDTAKVLLAAVIAALILIIIVWIIKVAISRAY